MREHVKPTPVPQTVTGIVVRSQAGPLRRSRTLVLVAAALLSAAIGCSPSRGPEESVATLPAEQASSDESAAPRVVCLGDSLTAGLGLPPDQAYPALLQQRLRTRGYPHEVVNAGVSGDTSAGGLRRLEWALTGDARVLVLALGANDGLRGLPVPALRRNLEQIIEEARRREVAVLLAGVEAPPNLGPAYTREFRDAYAGLAARHNLPFVPFLLEGVAGLSHLNQPDGIHPTAEGQRVIANLIWPKLEPLLAGQSSR